MNSILRFAKLFGTLCDKIGLATLFYCSINLGGITTNLIGSPIMTADSFPILFFAKISFAPKIHSIRDFSPGRYHLN